MEAGIVQQSLKDELEQIRLVLEDLLGRQSRWSGVLELTDDPGVNGAKPFRCDILINRALVGQDARWRTLIHEMLHTFSQGYSQPDYDQYRGWEEGVVEQLQRLLRPVVLARLGVAVGESEFVQAEAGHRYSGYIRALETLRQPLSVPPEQFHMALLAEPIKTRAALVVSMARTLPVDRSLGFMRTFSAAYTILKDRPK